MIAELLGHYRIVEQIGAGGMGVVYHAHDERLGRDVAIKVVPAGFLSDEKIRRRFRKEATTLSRLNHPNIEVVHDFDTQGEVDFLVTELIRGTNLATKLAGGPLPWVEAARFAMQAAKALQAAHKEGVIHCDLKPANLLVGDDGHLKIIDFGLAHLLHPKDAAGVSVTASSAELTTAGTLPYMAPEQLRGEKVDARTDIYALGVVLFEMTTGRLPFPRTQGPLLIDAILHEAPPVPSSVNPKVPPGLENIILKAMDKDPDHRYQSAREVLVDLERLTMPTPVVQPATGLWAKVKARKRLVISAATIICGVIVLLLVAGTRPALSFAARDWLLVTDFDNQTGDARMDRSLFTAFTVSLEQSPYANIFPRTRVDNALKRMGKQKVEHIGEAVGREICLRENIRGLVTCAVSKIGSQYAISARLVDPQTGDAVRSYMESAKDENHLLDALGRISRDIRRDLGESLTSLRKSNRPLPEVTTASLQALKLYADAAALWHKGSYGDGVALAQQAITVDPDFAMAHAFLGSAYFSHIYNDIKRGKEEMDKALALSSRTTERERLIIQTDYASDLRHYDEAARLFQAYLATYPDDHPMRYNFATMLRNANHLEQAVEQFKEVLRIAPNDASAYINLATTYSLMGKPRDALQSYAAAFRLEPTWVTLGNLNHEYGYTLVEAGDESKAIEVFNQALALPNMKGQALRSLALLDIYHGRYRQAETKLRDAIAFNQAKKQNMSEARNRVFLTFVTAGYGRRQETLRELELAWKALSDQSGRFNFGTRIAVELARNGAVDRAAAILRQLTKEVDLNNPDQATEFHRLQAEIQLARGQTAAGFDTLVQANNEADQILVRASLARAYTALGKTDEAIATWESFVSKPGRVINWEPLQPWLQAHCELAKLYIARGRNQDAAKLLDRFLNLWSGADKDLPLLKEAQRLRKSIPKAAAA
jgi:tetratricopeptide (TPR) repeat protein